MTVGRKGSVQDPPRRLVKSKDCGKKEGVGSGDNSEAQEQRKNESNLFAVARDVVFVGVIYSLSQPQRKYFYYHTPAIAPVAPATSTTPVSAPAATITATTPTAFDELCLCAGGVSPCR